MLTLEEEIHVDLPTMVFDRLPLYRKPCLPCYIKKSNLTDFIHPFRPISRALADNSTKENEFLTRFQGVNRTAESKPCRPSYGIKDGTVEFLTNYFPITLPDGLVLHRYSITIDDEFDGGKQVPEPKNKKLKRIIRLMLDKLRLSELRIPIATDFKSTLICKGMIPQSLWVTKIRYFHEDDLGPSNDSRTWTVRIEETLPVLKISDLKNFLASTTVIPPFNDRDSMLQALNIIFGHHAKSNLTISMVGGNKGFNNDAKNKHTEQQSLKDGLEAIRGYFLSVRLATFRAIVNVNVCHGAFYKAIRLQDLIFDWSKNSANWEGKWLKWQELETFLKGLKVKTNYLKDKYHRQVTQVRSIKSFATKKDGEGTKNPPRVQDYAAPPRWVSFYLDDEKNVEDVTKQSSKAKDSVKRAEDKYISVAKFFKNSTPISESSPSLRLMSLRLQHRLRSGGKISSPQLRFTKRSCVRAR